MFKKIFTKLIIFIAIFSFANTTFAYTAPSRSIDDASATGNQILEEIATKTGQKEISSVPKIFNNTIKIFLGVSSSIFLIFLIVGGFQYLGAKGNTEKIKDSFNLIKTGIIGLSIILLAYAITSFVISQINNIG